MNVHDHDRNGEFIACQLMEQLVFLPLWTGAFPPVCPNPALDKLFVSAVPLTPSVLLNLAIMA